MKTEPRYQIILYWSDDDDAFRRRQVQRLGDPEAARVDGHQQQSVLEWPRRDDQPLHFRFAQDLRQPELRPGKGEVGHDVPLTECRAVDEPQRRYRTFPPAPGAASLADEVQQVSAQIIRGQRLERTPEVALGRTQMEGVDLLGSPGVVFC